MRETDFIAKNEKKWKRYERALRDGNGDPDLLTELYVHTTDDLSYSRTFYPNRSVRVYLNSLAQRTFLQIYRGRKGESGRFFSFWTDELPRVVYANRAPLLISLAVFTLAMLIGVISYRIDGAFAETIMGPYYMDMTRENIASGDPMRVYKETSPYEMSLAITVNNIFVALLTFVSGVFFAVGAVVQLIRNGVMLGVFQYFFYDQGLFVESFLTIWIHGALEISAIVIAGGAGITMGAGLLVPGTLSRFESFKRSARDGLKIMLGTVPLFIIAGFLEGYLTRHTELPEAIRALFIVLCFAFILWYYYFYPRRVAQTLPPAPLAPARERADKEDTINRQRIRGVGENFAVSCSIMRRSTGRLFGGTALLAGLFTLCSFLFFDGPAFGRYEFSGEFFLADFHNFYELFATFSRGRGLLYLLLVAVWLYGLFRLSFQICWRATDRQVLSVGWRSEAYLFIICLGIALSLSFSPAYSLLTVLLLFPFLFVAAYAGYSGVQRFGQSLRYVWKSFGTVIGNHLLILLMAIPSMWLIDTLFGQMIFSFLDWIVYADTVAIDGMNVVLQCLIYTFLFGLMLCLLTVSFAIMTYTLKEVNEAEALLGEISEVGTRRRLRGMEME